MSTKSGEDQIDFLLKLFCGLVDTVSRKRHENYPAEDIIENEI